MHQKSPFVKLVGLFLFLCTWIGWGGSISATESRKIQAGEETIEIIRDSFGVPHVFAQTLYGAFFGQGYVAAEDRPFQLDRYRHDAKGTLAEIEGSSALEHDRRRRRGGYTDSEWMRVFNSFDSQIQLVLNAYRDGVNAKYDEYRKSDSWPEPFVKVGHTPEPWRVVDSLTVGMMMMERFGDGDLGELRLLKLSEKLEKKVGKEDTLKILEDLIPRNDPSAPATIRTHGNAFGVEKPLFGKAFLDTPVPDLSPAHTAGIDMALAYAESEHRAREYAEKHRLFTGWGSNAWVVSPSRSETGNAMLFGGPMMGFSTPQIAHEVHLTAPGLNVIGMAFAGIPTVLIGHNDHLAWTTTSGIEDMSDHFVETLHPEKDLYLYKGDWVAPDVRVEKIRVRKNPGSSPPEYETVEYPVYRTVHGPVVQVRDEERKALSISKPWFLNPKAGLVSPFLKFNLARNVEEFGKACSEIYSTHNFFCADRDGNIGYWFVGRVPIRSERASRFFPNPGTGEYDWVGLLPFDKMPHSINPECGYFGNWNNKPSADWDMPYGPIFWGRHIYEVLESKPKLSFEEFAQIAHDTAYDFYWAAYFKPYLLAALDHPRIRQEPLAGPVRKIIEEFDGRRVEGAVAPAIYEVWLAALNRMVFGKLLGDFVKEGGREQQYLLANLLLRMFQGKDAALKPQFEYLGNKSLKDVAAEALYAGVSHLVEEKGDDPSRWGVSAEVIDFGAAGKIKSPRGRGTYMQVVEVGKDRIRGRNILPPGQSEDPESPHYKDQLKMYENWEYKPMLYLREDLE